MSETGEEGAAAAVVDDPAAERFELRAGGQVAYLSYSRIDGRLFLLHTEVPPAMEGRGIGSRLARAALDGARAEGAEVVPFCPFVKKYIGKHPEYADLVRAE